MVIPSNKRRECTFYNLIASLLAIGRIRWWPVSRQLSNDGGMFRRRMSCTARMTGKMIIALSLAWNSHGAVDATITKIASGATKTLS